MEWVYKQLLELGPKQSKADQVGDLTENAVWRILKNIYKGGQCASQM